MSQPTPERALPPPLEARAPDCSMCGVEVAFEDDSWYCETCNCWWSHDKWDDPGQWLDDTIEQCPAYGRPFEDSNYENIQNQEYRCYLDADHTGVHRSADGTEWTKAVEHRSGTEPGLRYEYFRQLAAQRPQGYGWYERRFNDTGRPRFPMLTRVRRQPGALVGRGLITVELPPMPED